jgi:DNA-binding NtrC family response regulator
MTEVRTVLVVATSPDFTRRLERTLSSRRWQPTFVSTFAKAKRHLDEERPDLLISEIKLGEYNGLHLALRGAAVGVPAIVVGDAAFASDAEQLGAVWLSPKEASGERLAATMARLVELSHPAGFDRIAMPAVDAAGSPGATTARLH